MKILHEKCHVNKRRLVLCFELDGVEHTYTHDHWGDEDISELSVFGKSTPITPISYYKHRLLVWFQPEENDYGDRVVIIDRRYEHNHSFDVYYGGKHYLVGEEHGDNALTP